MAPKKTQKVKATTVVQKNQLHEMRPGGIVKLSAPDAELRRIEQELGWEGLSAMHVTFIFTRNAPMQEFPSTGDELVAQGFDVTLERRAKFTKAQRKQLRLLTPQELDEELAARTSIEDPAAAE
ncbi:MAG TPA: hypothetical protein VD838_21145 [Anaeromyxobacteraceae bacterium]|nr:hypothetical protein [Anaeromyxobacteraceae bacterium]